MGGEKLKVGCSGFCISKRDYYKKFNVVELQYTFYKIPKLNLVKRWREEAGEGFEFVIKVSQLITHPPTSPTYRRLNIELENKDDYGGFRDTKEVWRVWEYELEIAEILRAKSFLFQTPPGFGKNREDIERMKNFFKKALRKDINIFWEWRKIDDEIGLNISRELNLIPVSLPFERFFDTGLVYVRMHGGKNYKHKYTDDELKKLKKLVKGREGYVFFNNIWSKDDSLRFIEILNEE